MLIGCCASLLDSARAFAGALAPVAPTLAVMALALGATWCINTWDMPTFGLLVAAALALLLAWRGRGLPSARPAQSGALASGCAASLAALALTFGGAYALYLPFHAQLPDLRLRHRPGDDAHRAGPVLHALRPLALPDRQLLLRRAARSPPARTLACCGSGEPLRSLFPLGALRASIWRCCCSPTLVSLKVLLVAADRRLASCWRSICATAPPSC